MSRRFNNLQSNASTGNHRAYPYKVHVYVKCMLRYPDMLRTLRKIRKDKDAVRARSSTAGVKDIGLSSQSKCPTLNSDILALVFEELLACSTNPNSCRDLASGRLVCSAWNDAILSHPSLWCYIVVRDDGRLPLSVLSTLPAVLAQSGDCSLSVTFDLRGSHAISPSSAFIYSRLFTFVSLHMHRIQHLSVVLAHDEQARFLRHFDGHPAPRLRGLAIEFSDTVISHSLEHVQSCLFTGLHSLKLACTGLSVILQRGAALPFLRTLVLADTDFAWSELEQLFTLCPALEDLSILGFHFLPGGDPVLAGELRVATPLRRLALDRSFMAHLDVAAFLGAFARLPLSSTAEVEIGRVFPVWHNEVFAAVLETLFEHLPPLDTLAVSLDDNSFCLEGALLDAPGSSQSPSESAIQRTLRLPHGLPKSELRHIQRGICTALAAALVQPAPAFERLSLLRLPLSVWRAAPDVERIDGLLAFIVELDVIWDLRPSDAEVPALPRLQALSAVRLMRPRNRPVVITVDRVASLLRQYRMGNRPDLILRGVDIVMLEHDLDPFVARVLIE